VSGFASGYALLVGVGGDLAMTADDAKAVGTLLCDPARAAYFAKNVDVLTGPEATRTGILTGLERLAARVLAESNATVVVYYSGHGGVFGPSADEARYFLVPHGFLPGARVDTGISDDEFTAAVKKIRARRVLVLLDCCHAAGLPRAKGAENLFAKEAVPVALMAALGAGEGTVVLASCRPDERSYADGSGSYFTASLLEGLTGRAVREGKVRVLDLIAHVMEDVPKRDARQHPYLNKAEDLSENFVVCMAPDAAQGKAHNIADSASPPLPPGGKRMRSPASAARTATAPTLSGPARLALQKRLVTRWHDLSTYLEIPLSDQATFEKGYEPKSVLDWLEQRARLGELGSAFNALGWNDLSEELNRHSRAPAPSALAKDARPEPPVAAPPPASRLLAGIDLAECLRALGLPATSIAAAAEWLQSELRRDEEDYVSETVGAQFRKFLTSGGDERPESDRLFSFVDDLQACLQPNKMLSHASYVSTRKILEMYRAYRSLIARSLGEPHSSDGESTVDKFFALCRFFEAKGETTFLPAHLLLGGRLDTVRSRTFVYFKGHFHLALGESFFQSFPQARRIMDGEERDDLYGLVSEVFAHPDPLIYPLVTLEGEFGGSPVTMLLSRKYIPIHSGTASALRSALLGHPLELAGFAGLSPATAKGHELQSLVCSMELVLGDRQA
jgi:hypothetical protein